MQVQGIWNISQFSTKAFAINSMPINLISQKLLFTDLRLLPTVYVYYFTGLQINTRIELFAHY
jgi:hypothetical protein